nr:glycosyltransferase [Rhodococcus globerulus]
MPSSVKEIAPTSVPQRGRPLAQEALSEADLFVLPSVIATDGQMEGLPVVLMEALACGVPTVSTALSGIPEILIDGVTGRLVQPEDVDGLRKALDAVIADGKAAARHSSAGRKLVEREFVLADQVTVFAGLLGRYLPST